MPLKYKLKPSEIETVDEAIRAFYKETGDGDNKLFVLQVEGVVPPERVNELQTKVSTFRKTNTRLSERLKVFLEHAEIEVDEEMTPEDIADLLKEKRKELEDSLKSGKGGKMSKEEIEAEVTKRLEAIKVKHEADLKKLRDEKAAADSDLTKARGDLNSLTIGQEVARVGADFGLKAKALQVITQAALKIFSVKDGKVRCLDGEGDPVYGSDAVTEKSVADWIENEAMKEYDFAFESNSGGGASGGSGGAGRNGHAGPNPFKKDTWNLTRQMQLQKSDPATAKRLEAEATGR